MPISHKLRAIFVHVPKTGGTSISDVLVATDPALSLIGPAPDSIAQATGEIWLQHLTIRHLAFILPPEVWDAYLRFTFVRNPFDLVVSYYFYHRRRVAESADFCCRHPNVARHFEGDPSFPSWVARGLYMPTQKSYLADAAGIVSVNWIGRYENIGPDFEDICRQLGITFRLPHLRRTQHDHYLGYYTSDAIASVRKHFEEDFDAFEYL